MDIQAAQELKKLLEFASAHLLRPGLLKIDDGGSGEFLDSSPPERELQNLGPAVAGVGHALQIACRLQVVDEIAHGLFGHQRPGGKIHQAGTAGPQEAEDDLVRGADLAVARALKGGVDVCVHGLKGPGQQEADEGRSYLVRRLD